ncbi:hypothetical protein D3C85_1150990 [compost metagenome]
MRTLDLVILAVIVERLFAGPLLTQHTEVFIGTRIAIVLADVAAIGTQFAIIAAGNDVHGGAPAIEDVEGGELSCGQSRRGKTRSMGNQELEVFRHAGGVRGNQRAVRAVGVESHQRPVKPGFVMGACHCFHIVGLQDRTAARVDFRRMVTADVADEFNTHDEFLVVG